MILAATLLLGALAGFGAWLMIRELAPATPDLADVRRRMGELPRDLRPDAPTLDIELGVIQRIGLWAAPKTLARLPLTVPERDLAVLERTREQWFGEKVILTALGLMLGPLLALFSMALDLGVPLAWITPVSVVLAAIGFAIPDVSARTESVKARAAATRAVSTYLDLVVLELRAGSTITAALIGSAKVADSWFFRLLRVALDEALMGNRPLAEALNNLGERLGVEELTSIALEMKLAGSQEAAVGAALRAKADDLRDRQLKSDQGAANRVTTRLVLPILLMGMTVLTLFLFPAVMTLIG